jgi:hypothetical protein
MSNFDEFVIKLIMIFLTIPILGIICGLLSNIRARRKLKKFKENFGLKFASSVVFGFILIFLDVFFWIGDISLLTTSLLLNLEINMKRIIFIGPLWYAFIYFVSKIGFDQILGSSPPKPYLKSEDPLLEKGFQEVFKHLEFNLNTPLGKLKHRWAMPAGKFMACYLWDSAFISLIWKYWDKIVSGDILLPLFDNQSKDGRIPHFVGYFNKSDKTQPPLLAWAISNLEVELHYLEPIYLKLKKYNNWLYQNRRLKMGLFFWQHSYESGIDNSPRFTNQSEKHKYDLTSRAVIDLNTYVVLQNKSLIKIAKKLQGKTSEIYEKDILEFERRNSELIPLIQEYLWDDEAGLYFDYDAVKEELIKINTIASFFPLIAEIPTKDQVIKLVEHLKDPEEYNTLIPLPTVALNDPNFVKDTWRGPVWINTAYLLIKGLEKYQQHKLSSDLAFRLIKGVFKTWSNKGSFYEFYDPERFDLKELSRKKGNIYKQITLGGKPVKYFMGWTGLVTSLLIELVVGYDILENSIQPRLPYEMEGQSLTLGFPEKFIELRIKYTSPQEISITLIDLTGKTPEINKKCALYEKIFLNQHLT